MRMEIRNPASLLFAPSISLLIITSNLISTTSGHDFTIEGSLPHNTGGGQLSMGQAGAAGGFLGLIEAMRQLLGEAHGRQVADARHALVSGFGMINYDRGLCTAAAVLGSA